MFRLKRKSDVKEKEFWANKEYEDAVERCYKWQNVTLALCGFEKFIGFNLKPIGDDDERRLFVEGEVRFHGVVHEEPGSGKHVKCKVFVLPGEFSKQFIGALWLEHIGSLSVTLGDPTSNLKKSLIEGLRDAAFSGRRFMHIEIECPESTDKDNKKALSDIRAKDCGPKRNILAVKMNPNFELKNTPEWARRKD